MNERRWEELKDRFAEAVELPPAGRRDLLDRLAESDPELTAELSALLEHHEGASAFLETPVTEIGLSLVPPPQLEVGPYRIVRELATGGMGSVYLAERDDDLFDQQVAIKVVRSDAASPLITKRFESEMRILARLEHPNIARLMDGGVTAQGRPYFVMEYVDGLPLNQYCAEQRLDLSERLDLFTRICAAVQFAHRNLVLHRDLKPSNILVDGRGEPKLLDFGIAKLMTGGPTNDELTRTEARFLTAGYASPEQVRYEPLSTASDIYSLGVLLFELLTGVRPLDTHGLSPADTERVIAESEPARPSQAVRADTSGVPPRALRGDLDTIVLKALRKEPDRRYASAEALATDLDRFRRGLPISARADGWSYRAGKFLRRHRWGVSVTAAVLALIAFGTTTVARQSVRVAQERDRAEAVSAMLVDVFGSADPRAMGQREITARELLDRGVERVESRFAQDPVTGADLLDVIGQAYQNVGEYGRAQEVMERSREIRLGLAGSEVDLAQSLNDLGNLALLQGQLEEAEPLLLEGLARRRSLLEAPHAELAQSLNNLGQLRLASRDFDGADTLLAESLSMQRELYDSAHRDLAITLQATGLLNQIRGDLEAAERFYVDAIAMQREVLGVPHPDLAQTMNNLGLLLQSRGRFDEAEPLFEESLSMREAMLGSDHIMVAVGQHNLAQLMAELGNTDAARPLFEQSLETTRSVVGSEHPQTATVLNNYGDALRQAGDLSSAETTLMESFRIRRATLPEGHPHLAYSYNALGMLRFAQGDLSEATSLLAQAAAVRLATVGPSHPDLATTLHDQGVVASALGEWVQAAEFLDEALKIRASALAPGHPHVTATERRLAVARCEADRSRPCPA